MQTNTLTSELSDLASSFFNKIDSGEINTEDFTDHELKIINELKNSHADIISFTKGEFISIAAHITENNVVKSLKLYMFLEWVLFLVNDVQLVKTIEDLSETYTDLSSYKKDFKSQVNEKEIFNNFNAAWADEDDYMHSINCFKSFLWDMIDTEAHLKDLQGTEFQEFLDRSEHTLKLLKMAPHEIIELHTELKREWQNILLDISSRMDHENRRIQRNGKIKVAYLKIYRDEWLINKKAESSNLIAKSALTILLLNPSITSQEELDDCTKENRVALLNELDETNSFIEDLANSVAFPIYGNPGITFNLDELKRAVEMEKELMKRIYFLCHEDCVIIRLCKKNPRLPAETEQKVKIKQSECWLKLDGLKAIEAGRSLFDLMAIEIKSRDIYNAYDIVVDSAPHVVRGDSIEAEIEEYEKRIEIYNTHRDFKIAEQLASQEQDEINTFAYHLQESKNEDYINQHKKDLLEEASDYDKNTMEINEKINEILSKRLKAA
jgi:hypothetical protein